MSIEEIAAGIVFLLIVAVAGFQIGYHFGFRKGEAEAWLDHYFAGVARNRARRQRNGQFKAKTGGPS